MTNDIHAERRDPEQPSGAFDLRAAASELLQQARGQAAGRAARTLTPGAGAPLKQTLLAIAAGRQLDDHEAPGPATLLVLDGTVTMGTADASLALREGQWAAIPPQRHHLRADTDAAVLLTVALPAAPAG